MSWYKMAKPNDWAAARKELVAELKREPSNAEIQNKMMESNLTDDNKKGNPVIASKWKDKIPGGNADGKSPKDYEKSQVVRGKKIEFEHSSDPDTAREIAIDHLEEHKDYYVGLDHMEKCLKEIEERAKKK